MHGPYAGWMLSAGRVASIRMADRTIELRDGRIVTGEG